MKEEVVWIDAWQMQCCGNAFEIGSIIEWDVVQWTFEYPPVVGIGKIDYYYDHHNDGEVLHMKGIVTDIFCVYEQYALDETTNVKKAVSGKLTKCIEQATGWHKDDNEYKFSAYLASVDAHEII